MHLVCMKQIRCIYARRTGGSARQLWRRNSAVSFKAGFAAGFSWMIGVTTDIKHPHSLWHRRKSQNQKQNNCNDRIKQEVYFWHEYTPKPAAAAMARTLVWSYKSFWYDWPEWRIKGADCPVDVMSLSSYITIREGKNGEHKRAISYQTYLLIPLEKWHSQTLLKHYIYSIQGLKKTRC